MYIHVKLPTMIILSALSTKPDRKSEKSDRNWMLIWIVTFLFLPFLLQNVNLAAEKEPSCVLGPHVANPVKVLLVKKPTPLVRSFSMSMNFTALFVISSYL